MESTFRQGIIYSLTAYLLWGILPIYWKTLGVVQAFEILSNRFIWSCVFVWILIIASGRVKSFLAETQDIFTNPKQALAMLAAAITISFNWGLNSRNQYGLLYQSFSEHCFWCFLFERTFG